MTSHAEQLAIHGGAKALERDLADVMTWPIVTDEDERAVLEVLRARTMSGTDVTRRFEEEFASWVGAPYAVCAVNGTECLRAAMWACGVGAGDEIICPGMTYWASAAPALTLGAAVHFADIAPDTLCIDPNDIEHRIGPRTRAIVVVHYAGHPCDMDRIAPIAKRHGVRIIEDASHAHGTLYKGRPAGTLGDIACFSLMSGKGLVAGEGGIAVTADRGLFERAVAYGHYERTGGSSRWSGPQNVLTDPELIPFGGLPLGGAKHRMNQLSSAFARTQLKRYPERMAEIDRAMNRFWSLLEGVPGLRPHRVSYEEGSTMGPWYYARGLYRAEELGGLPAGRFAEAVKAEGAPCGTGANMPLHVHPLFREFDFFGLGKPTVLAFGQRDVRQGKGTLPVTERIDEIAVSVPWIKKDDEEVIAAVAGAFRKVAERAEELLAD